MDVGQLINSGLTILTLTSFAGLGLTWNSIRNLRQRATDAEATAVALRADRTDDRARIDQLTSDLAAAGRMLRNDAEVIALAHQIEDHNVKAEAHWEDEKRLLAEIRDFLATRDL